eukprot:144201-Rhodomonas_salina.3
MSPVSKRPPLHPEPSPTGPQCPRRPHSLSRCERLQAAPTAHLCLQMAPAVSLYVSKRLAHVFVARVQVSLGRVQLGGQCASPCSDMLGADIAYGARKTYRISRRSC